MRSSTEHAGRVTSTLLILLLVVAVPATAGGDEPLDRQEAERICDRATPPHHPASLGEGRCQIDEMVGLFRALGLAESGWSARHDCADWLLMDCADWLREALETETVEQWLDETCEESTVCSEKGLCVADMQFIRREADEVDDEQLAELFRQPYGQPAGEEDCRATDESCGDAEVCTLDGRCTHRDGECVAADPDDCRGSEICDELGQCDAVDGRCRATEQRPCESTDACRIHGRCQMDAEGRCRLTAKDCRESRGCSQKGRCSAPETDGEWDRHARCFAATHQDCADSDLCDREGRCHLDSEGECTALFDDDCRRSSACRDDDRCAVLDGECVAESKAERRCEQSTSCTEYGLDCTPVDGTCANPPDFDCTATAGCSDEGRCHGWELRRCTADGQRCGRDYLRCVPGHRHDCLEATACTDHDRCELSTEPDETRDRFSRCQPYECEPELPVCAHQPG